ncbi:MAG: KOW domain-containing RNA-binding protein [Clostridia bacterium]|nr:KOW domain-containing RNA-binding protein [Clostridia bacterium]
MNINPADIVYSKAGRDKGKPFVVISLESELFALIADGDMRKITKPKRKKIKHLKLTGKSADFVAEKLKNGTEVTNKELKKAIAEFINGTMA